jgi:hypothetical protein
MLDFEFPPTSGMWEAPEVPNPFLRYLVRLSSGCGPYFGWTWFELAGVG